MEENLENHCKYIPTHCKNLTSQEIREQTCETLEYKRCRVYQEQESKANSEHPFGEWTGPPKSFP